MGSGVSGLYAGTYGANAATNGVGEGKQSQPFSDSYGVTRDMLEYDRQRGVYSEERGYDLNPTTVEARNNIRDGVLVDHEGSPMDGAYTYAVREDGTLVIGKRNGNGRDGKATPHPTLVGGRNPRVRIAGIVTMSKGKIVKYDNESGHFKPNILSMAEADRAFSELPTTAFHRNFRKNMGRR